MSEEQAAVNNPEAAGLQSGESVVTKEPAQPPGAEQETQTQAPETSRQTEAEKVEAGKQTSLLTGDKPEEPGEQKAEEAQPEKRAPEEYADFTFPDAFKLENQDLTEFKSFAKEQDLTQEQAQKVLDFAGPKIRQMIEQPYKAWNDLQTKWQEEVRIDPEIGGTKYEQSVREAGNVFVAGEANPFVRTEPEAKALREALNTTGAGNNPAIVKLFVKMGRLLAEPEHLSGKPAPQARQDSLLNSMYPTMTEAGS
ncbi:MAG: hypothetical protein ACP5SH_18165 [Syntrophobacteraceae bacterium]